MRATCHKCELLASATWDIYCSACREGIDRMAAIDRMGAKAA